MPNLSNNHQRPWNHIKLLGALHLFLSTASPIQSTSPHPTSPRSTLILSITYALVFLVVFFPLAFPSIIYTLSSSPRYMARTSPDPNHPNANCIWTAYKHFMDTNCPIKSALTVWKPGKRMSTLPSMLCPRQTKPSHSLSRRDKPRAACRVLKLKLKLIYDSQSVGQSFLVPGTHLGLVTNFFSLLEIIFRHLRVC
jgi:hypothetical protein